MVFNSLHFLLFFLVVTPVYYLLAHRLRWAWLLAASCYFYMAFVPAYILILFLTIGIDYWVGIKLGHSPPHDRKRWLWLSITANLGILLVFKYLAFFTTVFQDVGLLPGSLGTFSWLLPIGLSFHTLQAMGYTIEVYRGNQEPERHLGIFALYVLFYPQLVAGPIERPQHLLIQFREKHELEVSNLTRGGRLILWGLFKKVVIADRLAVMVDSIYDHSSIATGPAVLVAALAFSVQIFCDFSGYTDIARGTARTMGFRLMENFNLPYTANSVSEFWRRWHISLSSWLRDYVYIPLGGNKLGFWRKQLNLVITFLLSGLWHGANYTFLVWGLLHAFYQFIEQTVSKLIVNSDEQESRLSLEPLKILLTFSAVTLAWIFFRASSLNQAAEMLSGLFIGWDFEGLLQLPEIVPITLFDWLINFGLMVFMLVITAYLGHRSVLNWFSVLPAKMRYTVYYFLVIAIVFLGQSSNKTFIYFQF